MTRASVLSLLCTACVVISAESSSPYDTPAPSTLRQVHMLMRHGKRAPLRGYPGDPNGSEDLWQRGFGHLVKEGLTMQDHLGRWLRVRYGNLLDRLPKDSQIHVISTDVDRTLNSAAANLAALYYLEGDQDRYVEVMPFTPVPIHTVPQEEDQLLLIGDTICPELTKQREALNDLPIYQNMTRKAKPLFDLLTTKLEASIQTLNDVEEAYDTFLVQQEANFILPSWLVPQMPLMKEVSDFIFDTLAYTLPIKTLSGGPLLQKITLDMIKKTSRYTAPIIPNLLMYSAHDVTIAINLQTLGAYNNLHPPYASAVLYELHERESGEYFVKVLYQNDSTMQHGPYTLTVPGCPEECPLKLFTRLLESVMPGPYYAKVCNTSDPYNYKKLLWYAIVVSTAVMIAIALSCVIAKCWNTYYPYWVSRNYYVQL